MFKFKKKKKSTRTFNTILKNPVFRVVEAYKTLRTNILFSVPAVEGRSKRFMFTSANPSEGKSTTSANIAITFAQQTDVKVLLIDADLRKATLHKYFGLSAKKGLSNFLAGQDALENCIQKVPDIDNLYIMASGVLPPNPAELLAGKQMEVLFSELDKIFDVVIVDTPPVNVVADALSIVPFVDGVTMVATDNKTTYTELQDAVKALKVADARILGVVLNRARTSNYRSRQKYSNYYRSNEETSNS
ncbi:MAG: CpsD/CapB family tyrosine-protein kinase [Clostridia bacterium]|nr:CpsD/CapB family tyrosine-protein kinase [Clostridia bacterium]